MKLAASIACATAGGLAFINAAPRKGVATLRGTFSEGLGQHLAAPTDIQEAAPKRVLGRFREILTGVAAATAVTTGLRRRRRANRTVRKAAVSVGDTIPDVGLDDGFPAPKSFPLLDFCKGKKVVLVGLPGAFTGT
jgi:hypothetical protein